LPSLYPTPGSGRGWLQAFSAEKTGISLGMTAMVFREAAHIQLKSRLYIVAAVFRSQSAIMT
jgi:hypothetical protein